MESARAPLSVAHVNAERNFSGGEVQVFLLIDGLRAHGYRNVLVCPPASASAREAATRGIACHGVSMHGELDAVAVVRLARWLRRHRPDLVHLHTAWATWLGGWAAYSAGVPAIATCRMERRFARGWRTRLIYETLVQRAVAISTSIADSLAAGGVPRERVCVIPSAVAPARLALRAGREATRRALGAPDGALVLLTIGALVHRKGLDVLLDALAGLGRDGLRPLLWVAGDGPEHASLAAQVVRLGLLEQVRFLGRRDDIGDLLAAADLFVMPSRDEGLGVAALEAMAAGRPVVATRVGGLQEAVIDGRTGLLVPPDDPNALATALARLLRYEALRVQLGAAGPARIAEAYDAEQMVGAYAQLYDVVAREWAARRHGR
jgi:glycosyltransferase involved in cell wall biosynthesis